VALEGRSLPSTFLVTSPDDAGPGSFRQAILDANATPGLNTIAFALDGCGAHSIVPTSALPRVTNPVVIDGTTQPGFAGTPLIELNGSRAGFNNGLTISAGGSTVRGLVINGFLNFGVALEDNGNNVLEGNYIGTDVTGTAARANAIGGVDVASSNNTIGGTANAAGNLISGNGSSGLGQRWGILIISDGATGNVVQGNKIGTDVTGTKALGNLSVGVELFGASGNLIGGPAAGAGNVVSGNGTAGISIVGGPSLGGELHATDNVVQGNWVGTDVTGTISLGNGASGVSVSGSNNTIGGEDAGAGNTIAFNRNDGVRVDRGTGNAILGNAIFGNGGLGIRLVNGGNHDQPAPSLTSAVAENGSLTVTGTLQARPSTCYTIELFVSSGGQGQRFLGSMTVTTDADGLATFTIDLPTGVEPGAFITATATDPGNDTSMFSVPVEVTAR
jgi:hypothetical protein